MPPVWLGEPAVAVGNVRGDGERGPVELIDEKPVTAGELLGLAADLIAEVDGLVEDEQLLEGERHGVKPGKLRVERSEESGSRFLCRLSAFSAHLFIREANRDDKTAIELFLIGIRGWEAEIWRRMDDGQSNPS